MASFRGGASTPWERPASSGSRVAEPVGGGGSLADAVDVVRRLAEVCGSTAMVVLMHYAATAVIDSYGHEEVRQAIGRGRHLTTLAFSEAGSRSHFWAPLSTATATGGGVRLDARKSWVTAAGEADSYVWSSRPVAADGPMSLWLVPADAPGLSAPGGFDGFGLRGNRSAPIDGRGSHGARATPPSGPTAPGSTWPWRWCCRGSSS